MNIFYLDTDPKLAAQAHCDKHVVKMCLEYAQLLSTALRTLNPEVCTDTFPYKVTHINHPCSIWVRQSREHYEWLRTLAIHLGKEYTLRYGKLHKSIEIIKLMPFPTYIANVTFKDPPQCMPDEYKSENVVEAYRTYYLCDKKRFATWKNRLPPTWWTD